MSNQRTFRRALILGTAAAFVPSTVVMASPILVEPPIEEFQRPTGPIIWQGAVPGATPDSEVVVHARPVSPNTAGELPLEVVGRASASPDGTFTVYAEPGTWYETLADPEGRIGLLVTASADNGRTLGMGMTIVTLEAQQGVQGEQYSNLRWKADEAIIASQALEPFDPSSGIVAASASVAAAESAPPTSPITMTDVGSFVNIAEDGSRVARNPSPPGYWCTAGQVTDRKTTWLSMGNYYHEEFGPNETFRYETTNTTSSEWGYKVGGSYGAFTLAGKVSFANQSSSSANGTHIQVPSGTKQKAVSIVNVEYILWRAECHHPNMPPGGYLPMDLTEPGRWLGDAIHFSAPVTATPSDNGLYRRKLIPQQSIGRNSGQSSSITNGVELSIGNGSLTGGVSYSTTSGSGTNVGRIWFNPNTTSSGINKWVKGYGGDPQLTGVSGVRGYT